MIELKAKCGKCGKVASYAIEELLPLAVGDDFFLPLPHHGCGGLRGTLIDQCAIASLSSFVVPAKASTTWQEIQESEEWPDWIPG